MGARAKHTPGPWTWDEDGLLLTGANGRDIIDMNDPDVQEANARLIAAAPELLETLEKMDGWLDGTRHDADHPWRISIRAAIAKARGES